MKPFGSAGGYDKSTGKTDKSELHKSDIDEPDPDQGIYDQKKQGSKKRSRSKWISQVAEYQNLEHQDDDLPDLPRPQRKQPWDDEFFQKSHRPIDIIRAFGPYVVKHKSSLKRAALAFLVGSTLTSMVPMSTKFVIDYVLPSRNLTLLIITAAIVACIYLLKMAINSMGGHILTYSSLHIVFDVRRRLFEHLQLLHLAFYEREQSGKLVSKLINDATALQILIQQALPILSTNVFTVLITFCLMFIISVKLTLFSLLILPCYFIINFIFHSRLYRRAREVRERNSVVAGNVNEVISGIKVVKSFGMGGKEHKRFVTMIKENLDYEMDLGATQIVRANLLDFIVGLSYSGIIILGGYSVMFNQKLTVGDYVAFWGLMTMLFFPMQAIANLALQTIQARTGLERILSILNIRPQIVDKPDAKEIDKIEGHVKLEDVCFKYGSGPEILNNINIEAQPGQVVAFVGPSGSGKSTIVNLLTRFYDVSNGAIYIDGINIRDIQLKSYQRRVGIVLQEPFLFSGTIRDNICYGSGRANQKEVIEAAKQANALEFIENLPHGFNTQVGERGQLLSGGQRQRISIARALLKDPDILILDEATSALDTESEKLVQQALDRLMRGRTVFVIAHRLTTIKNADKIIVLKDGQVEEVGDHHSLLAKNGLYSSLYSQNLSNELAEELENLQDE